MFAYLPLALINRLLGAEAWAAELLRPHAGQTALLDIAGLRLRFTVNENLRLQAAAADVRETLILRITTEALAELLDKPTALSQHAHIEGNAAFAETLGTLLQHLRPDLAGHFSPWLGDVFATRLARTLHSAGTTLLATGKQLGNTGIGLLRDEHKILVSRAECADFQHTLETLMRNIDRLDETLNRAARLDHKTPA